ncbi:MAG: carbohydrate kinase family protein, partial [Bacteroidales bacterium]|nr:carbohydrate kinase family protein [Bacteroidales bacterium]
MKFTNALELLGKIHRHYRVIISLNQNEAELVAGAYGFNVSENRVETLLKFLDEKIAADIVVIHRTKDAWAISEKEVTFAETFYVEKPLLLTGGGDNFNAG